MSNKRGIDNPYGSKPRKGKAKVKRTASGKKVSYGQAGKAKGGGPRVKPGTSKGDSYCARSAGIKKSARATRAHEASDEEETKEAKR